MFFWCSLLPPDLFAPNPGGVSVRWQLPAEAASRLLHHIMAHLFLSPWLAQAWLSPHLLILADEQQGGENLPARGEPFFAPAGLGGVYRHETDVLADDPHLLQLGECSLDPGNKAHREVALIDCDHARGQQIG